MAAKDLDKKVLGKLESYKEKYGLRKDEFVKSGSIIKDDCSIEKRL